MDDRPTAQSNRRWWERLESASEIALLIGCFLVVGGLVLEDWVATFRMSGEVAVIVGVMIEGLADGGIFLAAGKLRMIQAAELEGMRLEVASANARAAEANQKAERERLERLKLEEKLAPRRLSRESGKIIVSKLKLRGPDTPVSIFVCRHDSEMMRFANELGEVLQLAGWSVAGGGVKSYERVILGVWIETVQNVSSKDEDRAELLEETFQAEGIRVERHNIRTPPSFTTAPEWALGHTIQILVGEKP